MFTAIFITAVFGLGLGSALRTRRGGLIARTPYNNRYNDAPGARQDHLG
jgi:hypothetical protein